MMTIFNMVLRKKMYIYRYSFILKILALKSLLLGEVNKKYKRFKFDSEKLWYIF